MQGYRMDDLEKLSSLDFWKIISTNMDLVTGLLRVNIRTGGTL